MAQSPPPVAINPRSLNVGQDGCFFDPSTLSTFRQDNRDTAAVVGQPVGMVIDTWVANTLGTDTVTNGTFTTNTTGWTAGGSTLSVVSARMRVTNLGAAVGQAYQSQATTAGRVYKCTLDLVTNANGAQISVGPTNATSTLFTLVIPAGTTGSYTFYFIATSAASFIRLLTNSTTAGHFTEWDNVTCKHIPGKHEIQQTSTARPILRQFANGGGYWLDGDGVDDWLLGPLAFPLQLPSYLCGIVNRRDSVAAAVFAMTKNSTNHHYIGGTTANRLAVIFREGTIGQITAALASNKYPIGRCEAVDSLSIVGNTGINTGRTNPASQANSWLAGTIITNVGPTILSHTGIAGAATTNGYGGNVWMNSAPTLAQQAGMRRWFNDLCGGD